MKSTIKLALPVIFRGTSIGGTGNSTIQFPPANGIQYLILVYDLVLAVFVSDATTMTIEQLTNDRTIPTFDSNGDYSFTLHNLPWWRIPVVIRFN